MQSMELSHTQTEIEDATPKSSFPRVKKSKLEYIMWIVFIISLGVAFSTYLTIKKLKDQEESSIAILTEEISVKRWNENMLRTLGNVTYNEFDKGAHYYSAVLNERLIKYYTQHGMESIVDFGCGKCEYILSLNAAGFEVQGFDGHPMNEGISSFIEKLDLSQNITLPRTFDYVQSFEVGEHIYSDQQPIFIQNIVNHAREGIILSWAILGTPGYLHVNNRDNDYIIQKFEAHGFSYIRKDTQMLREGFTNHLARTIMVFHKN